MPLTIANNVSSLISQHNVGRSENNLKKSLERLSSGLKVNRGADGPAALVISEKQRTQIAGLKQAIDNSEKAVSLVQTAEGALNEINSLLIKIRSLALDSANSGVNDDQSLAANQAEIDNALDTINRIANNTQFGIKKLLDGSAGISGTPSDPNKVTFLKATTNTTQDTYTINVTQRAEKATVMAGTEQTQDLAQDEILTINGVTVELSAGMDQSEVIDRINDYTSQTGVTAVDDATTSRTRLISDTYGLESSVSVISNRAAAANTSGFANSTTQDAGQNAIITLNGGSAIEGQGNVVTAVSGVAKGLTIEIADDTASTFQSYTGAVGSITVTDNSMVFQIGPNQNQTARVAIGRAHSSSLGIGVVNNQFANLSEIDVTNASKAQDALGIIDAAVDDISTLRGDLGAFQQNTLEATANNLKATLENTVNAESVIRDTDFAEEIANFTKQQVLLQAGASVLSNSNQIPQLVLSLLGS
jgi:flagellin